MAIKGAEAKEKIIEKIKEAFGTDYLGEKDKKVYLKGYENGEELQIALSFTCPKTPVEDFSVSAARAVPKDDGLGLNFDQMVENVANNKPAWNDFTPEEETLINKLMTELGL